MDKEVLRKLMGHAEFETTDFYYIHVSEERKKNAIDLMVTMVVDELAEDMHQNPSELLPRFVLSQTGRLLYDEESKLWWSGPSDIAEMYKAEKEETPDLLHYKK